MSVSDKMTTAWGGRAPDWVEALARACEETSQAKTARRLGWSPATISLVLSNAYLGDVAAVEASVRAEILSEVVGCPELGTMPLSSCLEWREKASNFIPTSGLRGRMFDACRACPRNGGGS